MRRRLWTAEILILSSRTWPQGSTLPFAVEEKRCMRSTAVQSLRRGTTDSPEMVRSRLRHPDLGGN